MGNIILGNGVVSGNATGVLGLTVTTAPSNTPPNIVQIWAEDVKTEVTNILDLFEYSSDALAQAAYVSSSSAESGDLTTNLTSNTAPAPCGASASSENGTDLAYKAFDANDGTYWYPGAAPPNWITYDYGAGVLRIINKYVLRPLSATCEPKTWTLQGSTNNSDWDVLDTRTDITVWTSQSNSYTFANTTGYRYYKLNITAANAATIVLLHEMRLDGDISVAALTAYSESTIKTQGLYSMKMDATALATDKSLTRTITTPININVMTNLYFDVRAHRTGQNFHLVISNNTGTAFTNIPDIASADVWQNVKWDLSGITNDRSAITNICIVITNAADTNTI
jgi:hypothetical protein